MTSPFQQKINNTVDHVGDTGAPATGDKDSEILRLREEIERLVALQQEAQLAKDAFLANTTHELKTPLNSIVGYCDLILSESEGPIGNEQYKEYLVSIKKGGEKLAELVNDLLNVARHEAGKIKIDEEYVSPSVIVDDAVQLTRKLAEDAGQSIRMEVASNLPKIFADERTLRRALVNLIDNAVKYSASGDQITVGVSQSEERVALFVKDTGAGIEEVKLQQLMTPLSTADDILTRSVGGLGNGLAVAWRIANLHGADLSIESRVGVGTVAKILLPAFRNEVVDQAEDETMFFGGDAGKPDLQTLLKLEHNGFERVFYSGSGKILIGRNKNTPPVISCDIVVDDKRVSRPHGTISSDAQGFTYRDESRSGSYIVCEESEVSTLSQGETLTLSGRGRIYLGEHPLKGDAPWVSFDVSEGD